MNEITAALDAAILSIEDMKESLNGGDGDGPMAFLEASQDVQYQINRAVHEALRSFLSTPDTEAEQ